MSGLDDLDDLLGQLEGTKDAPHQSVANPTKFTEGSSSAEAVKPVSAVQPVRGVGKFSGIPEVDNGTLDDDDDMTAALGNLIGAVVEANRPKELRTVLHTVNLSGPENEIFRWLNNARTNPSSLVPFLRKHKASFDADRTYTQERNGHKFQYVTKEGTSAVQEAIDFLERQRPSKAVTAVK